MEKKISINCLKCMPKKNLYTCKYYMKNTSIEFMVNDFIFFYF